MLKLVILTNSARDVGERADAKKARVSPRLVIITD